MDESRDLQGLNEFSKIILLEKMLCKISFEGGVAGPLFNYDTNTDSGRGG